MNPIKPATPIPVGPQSGLTDDEARRRLGKFGPNGMPDTGAHPLRGAFEKFWAPVPWMLEGAIVLEMALGKYFEASIIAGLLVFNAALGLLQESRAQATLAALKSRLALNASVRRDGAWKIIPAAELVPGDMVKLSLGGVVAADVRLDGGEVLLDQSMLTGESVPIEAGAGRADLRGGAGPTRRSRGGGHRDRGAHQVRSHRGTRPHRPCREHAAEGGAARRAQSRRVQRRRHRYAGGLCSFFPRHAARRDRPSRTDGGSRVDTGRAARHLHFAAAIGARALAKLGVLPTRLSAVDEAASMSVLCADKTGTLTRNALMVTTVHAMPGYDEGHVLALAALASSDGGQDPVDGAIRAAAATKSVSDAPKLISFVPFDPATKMSEASRGLQRRNAARRERRFRGRRRPRAAFADRDSRVKGA
jgi:H+-transporting ATPase